MSASRRLAAIDVGSNTIHLLVLDCEPGTAPKRVLKRRAFVQLGAEVAATGTVGEARLAMAATVLQGQLRLAAETGAEAVAVGATQALRSARGGEALAQRLARESGASRIAILGPAREAQLAFDGATAGMEPELQVLLLDIGGASAQLALGAAGGRCTDLSLQLGSGTVSRLAHSDPPLEREWQAMERFTRQCLSELAPAPAGVTVVGTGGTITNLPRLIGKSKGSALRPKDLAAVLQALRESSAEELCQRSGVDLERVRLCRGGAVVLSLLLRQLGVGRLQASERGLRDGMVMALASRGPDAWFLDPDETQPYQDQAGAAAVASG